MKIRTIFLLGVCLSLGLPSLATADIRIAYSGDGNQHDADDWHASPMALGMIAHAGNGFRLVHFDYNNHIGDNEAWRAAEHHQVVSEAIQRFGFNQSIFYNNQWDLSGSVNSIARAINNSSSNDRLYLICAGPMEVCWRGINAAQDSKEQYVTVISHSHWNDTHQDTWQMSHDWEDIKRNFNVQALKIQDQNHTAFRSDPGAWTWLRNLQHGSWFYSAIAEGRKAGDASDAGMVYYVLDGRNGSSEWASMADIRSRFSGTSNAGSGGDDSGSGGDSGSGSNGGSGNNNNLQARNSFKCLEVSGGDGNGANVRQWNCNGNANQQWRMEDSWGGRKVFRAQHSNKCLDIKRDETYNGANARQWYCHKGHGQQYTKQSTGNGWFTLRAHNSGKCLTVANGSGANGASLVQWNCNGAWNQQFRLN